MPDRDELYRVGENEYMTGWGDPNYTRSLFGLRQDPYALQSQEEVNVTAPRPPLNAPYPQNMDEIYLGTNQVPPTGTYTPPLRQQTNVAPQLQPQWKELVKRYPFAQNFVQDVKPKDFRDEDIGGSNVGGTVNINANRAEIGDYRIPKTLAHEVTHAAQSNQFPGGENATPNFRHYMGAPFTPYSERPGEALAFETSDQAEVKRLRDIYNSPEARKRREQMAYTNYGIRPQKPLSMAEMKENYYGRRKR